MRPLNILTWHVHGNYLYYLSQIPHKIFLPVNDDRNDDYMGKGCGFPWGNNVSEVHVEAIPDLELDCVIYQRPAHYLIDRFKILSKEQQDLPGIYLEHDPPQEHPTNTKHCVNDPRTTVVHVTHFNRLMWDCGVSPTSVITHGVVVPENAVYRGMLKKGVVIINNLKQRGRRLGLDVFEQVRRHIPLDLIGMRSKDLGGIGEIPFADLPYFISDYRFVFNPIRYTSLGLAVCESMTVGMPIITLATTEQTTIIKNDFNGYIHTEIDFLIDRMEFLLSNFQKARELAVNSRLYAKQFFNINRFVNDWNNILERATGKYRQRILTR
jgi:glycosyltransferase involved in cell wall biosynthesis